AAQLALRTDAVDVVAVDHRRIHQRVKSVATRFALYFRLPQQVRTGGVQAQQPSAIKEARHEQVRLGVNRSRDRRVHGDLERMLPEYAPSLRVEGVDRRGVPDDELPSSGGIDNQ